MTNDAGNEVKSAARKYFPSFFPYSARWDTNKIKSLDKSPDYVFMEVPIGVTMFVPIVICAVPKKKKNK